MKRNNVFMNLNHEKSADCKQCIAFHEAGHAAAIYLNNKAAQLPPVSFQIILKDFNSTAAENLMVFQVMHEDFIARVKSGRSLKSLHDTPVNQNPSSGEAKYQPKPDRMMKLEINIINLLTGPLAEAQFIADRDGELFNHRLINLKALKNYGGDSDLEQVHEYLHHFSGCKQQQEEKMNELFNRAFGFIKNRANWTAISKLAHYILESNKNIIDCDEVASVIGH